MKENSLTSGKVLSSLIKFSLPIMAALFLQSLYGGVDLLIVGKFAETADVSAVSTGSTLMQTVTMVITGLTVGVTVLVGQKIGAKRKDDAGKVIGAGIVLFLLIGAVVSIILVSYLRRFYKLPKRHTQRPAIISACAVSERCLSFSTTLSARYSEALATRKRRL